MISLVLALGRRTNEGGEIFGEKKEKRTRKGKIYSLMLTGGLPTKANLR